MKGGSRADTSPEKTSQGQHANVNSDKFAVVARQQLHSTEEGTTRGVCKAGGPEGDTIRRFVKVAGGREGEGLSSDGKLNAITNLQRARARIVEESTASFENVIARASVIHLHLTYYQGSWLCIRTSFVQLHSHILSRPLVRGDSHMVLITDWKTAVTFNEPRHAKGRCFTFRSRGAMVQLTRTPFSYRARHTVESTITTFQHNVLLARTFHCKSPLHRSRVDTSSTSEISCPRPEHW